MTEEKDPGVIRTSVIVINPIPTVKKAGYVACSKSQRMKLADWLVRTIDFYVEYSFVLTALREQVPFSKLEVSRGSDGQLKVNFHQMFLICKKAGLAGAYFEYAPQEILENTVRLWYQEYKKAGGLPDPIAEEIFKEPASVINLRQ